MYIHQYCFPAEEFLLKQITVFLKAQKFFCHNVKNSCHVNVQKACAVHHFFDNF